MQTLLAEDFSAVNADEKTIYYKITSSSAPYEVAVFYQGTNYNYYPGRYSGSIFIPIFCNL
jgi:hypothetical protein